MTQTTGGKGNGKGEAQRSSITERRKQCLLLRDALFACFDRHGIDSVDEQSGTCADELEGMYAGCQKSWVKFFLERRAWEKEKREFVDFIPADSPHYEEHKHRLKQLVTQNEDNAGSNSSGAAAPAAAGGESEGLTWEATGDQRKKVIEMMEANYGRN